MTAHPAFGPETDLILCLSHLRWDHVWQRPHHLMSRAARAYCAIYLEEPVRADEREPRLLQRLDPSGVTILTPSLPEGVDVDEVTRGLMSDWLSRHPHGRRILWYYTPMALGLGDLGADLCVYDCMDELWAFNFAPTGLREREERLLRSADIVFAGGRSLHEARLDRRPDAKLFPSSVDAGHFATARAGQPDPDDQADIPRPRVGFFGVIDERMDLPLVERTARALPDVQFVMLGPVAKIDPARLPRLPNIHWLGSKPYPDLPLYLANWSAGWMPFALNRSTQFISPTKTPEFLAAGLQVVSTAVPDVVCGYGDPGLVRIADADSMPAAIGAALEAPPEGWSERVDQCLEQTSWDATWAAMSRCIGASRFATPANLSHLGTRTRAYDWLVVGAGFAGSVLAERLASQRGERVLVIDRRPHIAGNAFDRYDDAGILIHQYGPHIFHTNSQKVADYLSQFTDWRDYAHRVLAHVDGQLLPIPINLDTVNRLYGLSLDSAGMERFLAERREEVDEVRTSEDVVVSTVGRDLYEKFFRGYTRKQWGVEPSELAKSVTSRIPVRTNRDDRYFGDTFQKMPAEGYTRMFERMLDHPLIDLDLGTDFRDLSPRVRYRRLVFTGPIDEFFDYRLGRLPYRSLTFRHVTRDVEWAQPVAVVNYTQTEDYTRVTEYKHLTGQLHPRTSLTYEYPSDTGDPYYPIPRSENEALYRAYGELARGRPDVLFVGRLATYRYYNMDQVVGQALSVFARLGGRQSALTAAGAGHAAE